MLNYENGKKLTLLGFAAVMFCQFTYLVQMIGRLYFLNTIFSIGILLGLCAVTLGFAVMWYDRREMLDLLTGGTVGVALLIELVQLIYMYTAYMPMNRVISFLLLFVSSVFFLALAYRIFQQSPIVAAGLGCAFLFQILQNTLFNLIARFLPYKIGYIMLLLGGLVCYGLCVVERYAEE